MAQVAGTGRSSRVTVQYRVGTARWQSWDTVPPPDGMGDPRPMHVEPTPGDPGEPLAEERVPRARRVEVGPDVGDEVLVAFQGGDPRHPIVIGALWNGQDSPPVQMDGAGQNNLKEIVSRNDIRIILDDSQGQETVKRGEALYQAGAEFSAIYAIRSGSFKASLFDGEGREQVSGFFMGGELAQGNLRAGRGRHHNLT